LAMSNSNHFKTFICKTFIAARPGALSFRNWHDKISVKIAFIYSKRVQKKEKKGKKDL